MSAQFVIGTGLFTDFFSGWTDFFGTHSHSYQTKLDRINKEALERIQFKAAALGANAVLGLRVDHDEIAGSGKSMLMVTGSGTAVKVKPRSASDPSQQVTGASSITAEDLRSILERNRLIARGKAGTLEFTEPAWNFLTENQVYELGEVILARVANSVNQHGQLTETGEEFIRRAQTFFLSLPAEESKRLLYAVLADDSHVARFAREIVRRGHLLDIARLTELLETATPDARKSALQVVGADLPVYTVDDKPELERLLPVIRSSFLEEAQYLRKDKLLGGSKEVWKCRCDSAMDLKEERCSNCTRDKFGFFPNVVTPATAGQMLTDRIAVLKKVLALDQA